MNAFLNACVRSLAKCSVYFTYVDSRPDLLESTRATRR